jgi:alanine racemase
MDQTVIDLRSQQVHVGEIATVFGPGTSGEPTAADWAAWAGTIEHEIVTGIGARVHRQATAACGGSAR